jgi:predicted nucleotidyltransferase
MKEMTNKSNDFSDMIKEAIESNDVDVSSIQMHETLHPLFWESEDKIKPDIRKILLKNAKRFIEFSGIKDIKFQDIVLTGSMANYNYNDNSDLDIHIIFDFSQISENKEFISDYFKLKKDLWSSNLPIQVKGYDVEMYFQDSNDQHMSTGVYSLFKDAWIRMPLKKIINIDIANVKSKATDMMNLIDDLLENISGSDFVDKYKTLKDKIKKYRQSGLDVAGEFSTENLVFKILRNMGYLEKLIDAKNEYLTNELSMSENKTNVQ